MDRSLAKQSVELVGKEIKLQGWVDARRDHGKIIFLDLRDRSGIVQLVLNTSDVKEVRTPASSAGGSEVSGVRSEYVIEVVGLVKQRPASMVNPKISTGTVEVEVKELRILSRARELPFPIDTDGYEINEEVRLKYRYLDIRRPRINRNLRLRSKMTTFIRNYLTSRDFVEVETPILTKTTPEGARDFIVPSRLQKGKFYALPQSPQQYKQLLMVAGLERYFQIARCFRDEDPRHDRAYGEFTQLDIEMSFVTQNEILTLTEDLFTKLVAEIFPEKHISQTPWPRIAHAEAKAKYGTDKPDLRKDKKDHNELAFSWTIDFPLFTEQSKEDFYHGSGKAKFAPSHHMFVSPHPDDISLLETHPFKVRGIQHDLVLNSYEVGGGSIRIHQREVQEKVFDLIGFTEKQKGQFAHMLTAFTYGVPPHGGIAPGIDRFLMAALGEPSVREVMAYPATSSGQIAVMDAPSEATPEQLQELGISIRSPRSIKEGVNRHTDQVSQIHLTLETYQKVVEKLKNAGVQFKPFEHEPVYTSEDAARVRNTPIHQGAKALVLYGDKKPLMVVLPADRKLEMKAMKEAYGIRDLRMATVDEVQQVTGVPIGAVPPLGNLFNIPVYMDEGMRDNKEIFFNAGLHTKSISMRETDFEAVVKPIVGKIAKTP